MSDHIYINIVVTIIVNLVVYIVTTIQNIFKIFMINSDSSKEELFNYFKEHPNGNTQERIFKLKYPKIYNDIISWEFPKNFKWSQKLYHYFNNDINLELGKCNVCGNRCSFISIKKGYNRTCSKKCMYISRECHLKSLNLSKEDCLKYLLEHPKGNIEKVHFKKRFPNFFKIIESINFPKSFKWTQKLYHYFHNDLYFNLGKCKMCGDRCKFKSFNNGYYVYCSVKCMNSDPYIKDKIKLTNIKHFGVPYAAQSIIVQNKMKQSTFQKYGVDSFSQTNEFAKYHRKQIEYNGLTFDSSWEVKVYQYCKENSIPCEYQPNIQFEYEYDGKTHIYQPDFLINGKLYEVKGDQFFDGDKMICPYNRSQDGLYEEKHQCMKDNGIIIIKKKNINTLSNIIKK